MFPFNIWVIELFNKVIIVDNAGYFIKQYSYRSKKGIITIKT